MDENEKIIVHADPDIEELIPDFLANRREDLISIKEFLKKNDLESIRILGHSMKGSGGGYGFDHISEIGGLIEEAANTGDVEKIKLGVEQLSSYLDRLEVVYE